MHYRLNQSNPSCDNQPAAVVYGVMLHSRAPRMFLILTCHIVILNVHILYIY